MDVKEIKGVVTLYGYTICALKALIEDVNICPVFMLGCSACKIARIIQYKQNLASYL